MLSTQQRKEVAVEKASDQQINVLRGRNSLGIETFAHAVLSGTL